MSAKKTSASKSQIVQAILDNTTAVIYAKDLEGRYQLINRRFEELFGITAAEIEGRTDFDVFPAELAEKFHRNDLIVSQKNEPIEFEEIAPHADGPHTYISLKLPYNDDAGRCIGTCGISTDITRRKRIEAELQQSDQRFRQLAENVPECFWITDVETWRVLYVNPAFERIWQRPCNHIYDNPDAWLRAIHPADRKRIEVAFFENVTSGNYQEEYRIVLPDGTIRWIADRGFPVKNEQGQVYRVAGIAEDITQRRELEQQVTDISSHERQRISRELHDSLGQQLTGLGYLAKSLTNRLANTSPSDQEIAAAILDGVQAALSEVRRIVRGLAPVDVDVFGLKAALQELAASVSDYSGLDCQFICPQTIAMDENTVAMQLFRIAQEAANNAVKHSGAARITISLEKNGSNLLLEICDDGAGRADIQKAEGMGLRIMRYRSNMIGAEFNIQSTMEGTKVTCMLNVETKDG